MKKKDLYDALSGIDEKYLSDSENFSEISAEFRRAEVKKISTVSSLCGCSLILAAVFLSYNATKNNFDNAPEVTEKSNTIQTDIIMTTEGETEITENSSEISSDCPAPTENSGISDNTISPEIPAATDISVTVDNTDIPVIEPVQTEIPDIIGTTPDDTADGYNKPDFSGISVDEWLENPDVIWCGTDTKGYLYSEYIPSGNTKISEKLSDSMQINSDDTVYAVMVDFSSCINENELSEWQYNGDTIADLKMRISEITEYSEKSFTYIDSDGTEHTEYFLTSESEVEVEEIEQKINEIKSAYRDTKIQEFADSFHNNGLEIYTDRISGIQEENFCFYTFATQNHLKEFKCKDDEAFIFYPANYFK